MFIRTIPLTIIDTAGAVALLNVKSHTLDVWLCILIINILIITLQVFSAIQNRLNAVKKIDRTRLIEMMITTHCIEVCFWLHSGWGSDN